MLFTNFEVPFVDDILGHSIIYEEYKGDYDHALKLIEEKLDHARINGSPTIIADALLAKGIVHLLRGEPPAATTCFNEINNIVSDDAPVKLRATSYSILAEYMRLNTFPNGSGAGLAGEIGSLWQDFVSHINNLSERLSNLKSMVQDPRTLLETDLVYNLLCSLLSFRSSLDIHTGTEDNAKQLAAEALKTPLAFEKKARAVVANPRLLAYTYLVIADVLRRAKQHKSAYTYLSNAYKTYSDSNDYAGAAACLMLLGDWHAAPNTTPLLWNHSSLEGVWNTRLSWTLEQIELDRSKVDMSGAENAYAEAERLFSMIGARRGLAAIQLRYGYLSMLKGDFDAAVKCAINAQNGFRSTGDNLGYWIARAHHALSRIGADQMPEDLATAKAIGVWGSTEGSFSYALGLGVLFSREGHRWLLEGSYERAIRSHRLARTLYDALGANINLGMSLADMADIYLALGERKNALTFYENSLGIFERDIEIRSQKAETAILRIIPLIIDLHKVYLNAMNADGIERCALRLKKQIAKLEGIMGIDDNSNFDDLIKGWDSDSSDLLSGTIDNAKFMKIQNNIQKWMLIIQAGHYIENARVLCPLYRAVDALDRGDTREAETYFGTALDAANSSSAEQRDFFQAIVFAQQKKYRDAIAAFERHLTQKHSGSKERFEARLINLMHSKKDYEAEARREQERGYEQSFLFMVRTKAYAKAKQYLEALEQSAGIEWYKRDDHHWENLTDCGEMYEGLNDLEVALECYSRAINELERRRHFLRQDQLKKSLAGAKSSQHLYFQAARTALKLQEKAKAMGNSDLAKKYFAEAFNYAEHGKARALLDLMAAGTHSITRSLGSEKENETVSVWRELCAQLNLWYGTIAHEHNKNDPDLDRIGYLNQKIKDTEQKLHNIELELSVSEPGFYSAISPSSKVITLEDIMTLLPSRDTALIQYYFVDEDFLAWTIVSSGLSEIHRSTIDTKVLERQIRDFRKGCEAGNTFESISQGLGQSLAKVLLVPFTKTINKNSNLILVPFGAANILPFHVLPWEKKPLGSSHTLSYLPNASTLQFLRRGKNNKHRKTVLSIGNPSNMALSSSPADHDNYENNNNNNNKPLMPLPAAEIEACFVASTLPDSKVLIQEYATEESVRRDATHYPILHFATHGYLSDEAPLLSSVLLANGGSLSLYELMGLRLDTDLVVLSACNTGLGEITAGDDVIGLAQGLLGAGALSVLVSLWAVNDISTALFMGKFYSLIGSDKSPAFALKAAQEYLCGLNSGAIALEIDKLRSIAIKETMIMMNKKVDVSELFNYERIKMMRDARRTEIDRGHDGDYKLPFYWAPFILIGGIHE
jgi:CHAT domain-containing protein/tetratricopeptide (TPR) repeat protein